MIFSLYEFQQNFGLIVKYHIAGKNRSRTAKEIRKFKKMVRFAFYKHTQYAVF